MLRPTKHSHPDRTVIHVALRLLGRLKKHRLDDYDSLRDYVRQTVAGSDAFFLPALSFLYLLGLIEYHPKTDAMEYVGPQ